MKKGFARRLIWGGLLTGVAIYLLLPVAARYGLEHWLRAQGYQQVAVDSLKLEPFAGELRVKGLRAQRDDAPPLTLGEGYLNIAWLDLWRRQGHLQGLAIDGLDLALSQDADGRIVLNGLPLPAPDKKSEQGSRWGFGIDRLGVRGSRLVLDLPGLHQPLKLDKLVLTGLRSWDPDNPATLTADGYLGDAHVRIDGELSPFASAPAGQLRLRISGARIAELTRDMKGLLPDRLSALTGTVSADLDLQGRLENGQPVLDQRGDIRIDNFAVTFDGARHSLDQARWAGTLTRTAAGGLTSDGTLDADKLVITAGGTPQEFDSVHWQGRINGSGSAGVTASGTLLAEGLAAMLADTPQSLARARWQGEFGWSPQHGASSDGQLSLTDARLAFDGRTVTSDKLDWSGKAGWSATQGATAEGSVSVGSLTAEQPEQQMLLATWKALRIPSLAVAPNQAQQTVVRTDGISIDAPTALRGLADKAKPLFDAKRLTIGRSTFTIGTHLALGPVNADGAQIILVRKADGGFAPIDRLATGTAAAPTHAASAKRAAKTPPLRISLAGLTLGEASRIDFTDHSVTPRFKQNLDVTELTVGVMDSASPGDWTPVVLKGRLGEYSRLALKGQAQPFSPQLNLQLDGTLQSVNLPPLSSYTTKTLGYTVQSGQMNSEISIKVTNDVLAGEARLVLNKLTVKAADAKRLARLTRELSMPLDAALNMLRDSDDNIRLSLPVSGDITQPSFDMSDVINTAMGNALKKAAISYIKYALQPYGSLITLAEYAGKAANRLALKDVPFPTGSATPAPDQAVYLEKVVGLLNERPKLTVRVCGVATASDRAELATQARAQGQSPQIPDDALLTLAQQRSADIKRRLVDQGIAPDRLFICNPEIRTAADASPRVELSL